MNPSKVSGDLFIKGTEGGWADAQGDIIKKMLQMGKNINTPESRWAIGDMAANRIPVNEQTIQSALSTASEMFGGN